MQQINTQPTELNVDTLLSQGKVDKVLEIIETNPELFYLAESCPVTYDEYLQLKEQYADKNVTQLLALKLGDKMPAIMCLIGNRRHAQGRHNREVIYYLRAMRYRFPLAMYNLALCFMRGNGVKANAKEAIKYYTMSANAGLSLAQCNLGVCYALGSGVKADYTKAFSYYMLASNQNNATAICNMASCYLRGTGVDQNKATAIDLYKKAIDLGDNRAKYRLDLIEKA